MHVFPTSIGSTLYLRSSLDPALRPLCNVLAGGVRGRQRTLSAKNTAAPRKKGGSPIALDECASGVCGLGASFRRVTRKSMGMSFAVGILYVPARSALREVVGQMIMHYAKLSRGPNRDR